MNSGLLQSTKFLHLFSWIVAKTSVAASAPLLVLKAKVRLGITYDYIAIWHTFDSTFFDQRFG